MIRIDEIKIPLETDGENALLSAAAKRLGIEREWIRRMVILRRSVDARKKPAVYFVYSVAVEATRETAILKKDKKHRLSEYRPKELSIPRIEKTSGSRPVVVGAGPAGLFAAYVLAKAGLCPLVIERGEAVEDRSRKVEEFFAAGRLDPESNVLFGEGGAGTFSDGKLNTSVKDKTGRHRFVLQTFVEFGANPSILYEAKPHIGTDRLLTVIPSIRQSVEALGGEVLFHTRLEKLLLTPETSVRGILLSDGKEIACDTVILATGHSARDTFAALYAQKIPMTAKAFAVGFRVEHPQEMIDLWQYGGAAARILPAAPYKLVARGLARPVYSFCMCPGGYVINSSSEAGGTCVNGMSFEARDSRTANSAIVVAVGEKEYDLKDPMAAIAYQRKLERAVYERGQGAIIQQLFGDFEAKKSSTTYGGFATKTKGRAILGDLRGIFSEEIETVFCEGLHRMDAQIKGFADPETILSGVESRTYSPIRILRDENCMSPVRGLYPCGEGAGYAGGIASAAMDGTKVALCVIEKYEKDFAL